MVIQGETRLWVLTLEYGYVQSYDLRDVGFMLYAYLDESGQDQRKEWMAVAGFLGNEEEWQRASTLWADGIKPRTSLHMRQLRFNYPHRVRPLLDRAGAVPYAAGLVPLFAGVRVDDYHDLVRTIHEKLMAGYLVCCISIVVLALQSTPDGERIKVAFEDQPVYSGWGDCDEKYRRTPELS